ncbi:MAG: hypothetical protein IPP90_15215 [Gemmatimonadaceae bacterium]|nr:hypothetical protein [Gemmatimonadaceae bacterium]
MVGFGLGMKHALEPDHLVAVSTLMRGESRRGRLMQLGALWGAGHLSTVALGVGILTALRITLVADHLVLFEVPVAAMLIGLGLWTLVGAAGQSGNDPNRSRHENAVRSSPRPAWWSYAVGSVHGLAGTGALVIFVAATFPDVPTAITYVVLFGVGAMLGMALITSTLAYPLRALEGRPTLYRMVTAGAGGLSVLLGVSIVIELVRMRG